MSIPNTTQIKKPTHQITQTSNPQTANKTQHNKHNNINTKQLSSNQTIKHNKPKSTTQINKTQPHNINLTS